MACTGARDYTVRLWDLETADCVQTGKIARNVVTFVRRVPGERAVLQASEDLRLRVWDVRDMSTAAQTLEARGGEGETLTNADMFSLFILAPRVEHRS